MDFTGKKPEEKAKNDSEFSENEIAEMVASQPFVLILPLRVPYPLSVVKRSLGIGMNAITLWKKLGLPTYLPRTKNEFVLGIDVCEFIQRFPVKEKE